MSNAQTTISPETSGSERLVADKNASNIETDAKVSKVINYLKARIKELESRVAKGSRSIFDFADLAIIVSTLVYYNDGQTKDEANRYKSFIKANLLSNPGNDGDLIATAFYCLMRCGIIHEMSLSGHATSNKNQVTLSGCEVYVTHDSSKGKWFFVDHAKKEITFYIPELIGVVKKCLDNAAETTSTLWAAIASLLKNGGINIIRVKGQKK